MEYEGTQTVTVPKLNGVNIQWFTLILGQNIIFHVFTYFKPEKNIQNKHMLK